MARVSFRLRSTALREHSSGPDDTDGLRADGLQTAPQNPVTANDTFFAATSTGYGELDLSWALPLTGPGTDSPEPTEYVIVYSPFGPPETVSAGTVVVEGATANAVTHTGLAEGVFAYYSLFVRYVADDEDYYEKVASLGEIVPKNYQSTLDLWERIPDYWREQDTRIGTLLSAEEAQRDLGFDNYGSPVGPLLRFLSIFGFSLDRYRSVLAHIARASDPSYADTQALDAIAQELGSLLRAADLGTPRLRNFLNDVGVFRRVKGTPSGTQFFAKSITGADTEIDTSDRSIDVSSGRVNYILDPQNTKSVVDIESSEGVTYLSAPATQYTLASPVDVVQGDVVSFSIHSGVGVLGNVLVARLVDTTTDDVVGEATTYSVRNGVPYFDIVADTAAEVNVQYVVRDDATLVRTRYLLEKNSTGDYFDGSVVRGGWLVSGTSISDFRWEGGDANAHNARSLYSEDYERTKQVFEDLYRDVLPVTVDTLYSVTHNNA